MICKMITPVASEKTEGANEGAIEGAIEGEQKCKLHNQRISPAGQ